MGWRSRLVFFVLALLPLRAAAQATDCSVAGQNGFVRAVLQEYYLWYHELPDPDPASFTSPEAYLEAVRYRPLDTSFSYVTSKAASDAFYSDSQYIGFGFSQKLLSAEELRITEVYAGSPAEQAGLARGARILEIDGRRVADLVAADQLGGAFGPSQIGFTVNLRFQDPGGDEHQVQMAKGIVTIPTVSSTRTFDTGGRRVGYLNFRNFVQPSVAALNAAFFELRQAGASDLVLDLRYNGGGLVSVAQHLGSLIGGTRTLDQVFARFVHNDKNSFRDSELYFESALRALSLPRLVVITTRSSASASELVVNGLRPFIPVTVVGDTTYGKPVGQYGFAFCDKVLYPVAFSVRNARNEGDYFGGIAPDCPAPDDLGHALGDSEEGSLAAALYYAANGTCSSAAALRAQSVGSVLRQPHEVDGWRQLVGAF